MRGIYDYKIWLLVCWQAETKWNPSSWPKAQPAIPRDENGGLRFANPPYELIRPTGYGLAGFPDHGSVRRPHQP